MEVIYSIGEELNLSHFKYDLIPDFKKYELIEKSPGDNAIYYDPESERFIKFLNPSNNLNKYNELKREILIGKFLHAVNSRNVVNIIGSVDFPCDIEIDEVNSPRKEGNGIRKSAESKLKIVINEEVIRDELEICEGLITRQIKGVSLADFIKKATLREYKSVLIKILTNLLNFNELYQFTHYDLHPFNIFVSSEILYNHTYYYPVFLDFGSSYIEIPVLEFYERSKSEVSIEEFYFQLFGWKTIPQILKLGRSTPQLGIYLKSYLITDFVKLLTTNYSIACLNYQKLYQDLLDIVDGQEGEEYDRFRNLSFKNMKEFFEQMEPFTKMIEDIDRFYEKNFKETLDFYQNMSDVDEKNLQDICSFCTQALNLLDHKINEHSKCIQNYCFLKYENELNNINLRAFVEELKYLFV